VKFIKCAALAATLLGCLALGIPANAQFSGPPPLLATGEIATPAGAEEGKRTSYFLAAYPYAPFKVSTAGVSADVDGFLISGEASFLAGKGAVSVGLWYWKHYDSDADILEFHGKYYFTPKWGAQFGILTFPSGTGTEFDLYGIYNFASSVVKGGWNASAGLGIYFPDGGDASFSAFIEASYNLSASLLLNLSYWYINYQPGGGIGSIDISRFGVGIGYKFQ
jgi:hypothetical protein